MLLRVLFMSATTTVFDSTNISMQMYYNSGIMRRRLVGGADSLWVYPVLVVMMQYLMFAQFLVNDVIPDKIDKVFLHEWGIDYVALRDDKAGAWKKMVDTEVCNDGHCILFSENGVARAVSLSDMKA
eukprot:CAMPEP_0116045152 /NCGR_PEP_ID=MMETSP0321-20121206/27435_1 /TAXON_ID=163516 /ORGANISM="Leptocylindrus danicus var. danicus, Strain B650" /LENGTH=126 /DNA_ID=CAMNT_0003526405 /DNA_START=742 /DNA_END=1121 /DNA_ORIENTATION=-